MTSIPRKLGDAIARWDETQPWYWSLDTMIGGTGPDGVRRGKVPEVEIGGTDTTGMDAPYVEGGKVVVGPMWWDTHAVEERRQALYEAVSRPLDRTQAGTGRGRAD